MSLVACAGALLAPTWSCLDPTEIDLRITTDEAVSAIAPPAQAQILVGTPEDVLTTPSTAIDSNAVDTSGSFGDLVVAPNGDIGADVAVRVVLGVTVPTNQCAQSPQDCIVASRTIRYVSHHKLVLPVQLEAACLGVQCDVAHTCVAGKCVDNAVDTNLCDGGTCGTGSLVDGSVLDGTTVDAPPEATPCNVAKPATCGSDTCVDFATNPAHCGGCSVDCSGGTCANGTCQLAAIASTTNCLGLWNGSVYVATQDGSLYTIAANGGAATPVTPSGGAVADVATRGLGADLAYSFAANLNWEVDEKANGKSGVMLPSGADRIALDLGGFAWLSLASGQLGYASFTGTPSLIYTTTGNYAKAWLAVAANGAHVYASLDGTQLCHIVQGTSLCLTATSSPAVLSPAGVVVSDPSTSNPTVYFVENGTDVSSFDDQLATKSSFATGGVAMAGLAWDKATLEAYAISDAAIFKSSNNKMNELVAAPNAVPRCIVLDANAVYWLESPGGVFKHAR